MESVCVYTGYTDYGLFQKLPVHPNGGYRISKGSEIFENRISKGFEIFHMGDTDNI